MVIYMTINKLNGKKYIGRDANNNPRYLGSGVLIKQAIEKYGSENFDKIILEDLTGKTKKELREREYYWLEYYNAPDDQNFYNLSWNNGGFGKEDKHTEETKQKISNLTKEALYDMDPEKRKEWVKNTSDAAKGRIPWNKNVKFTEEEKKNNYSKRQNKRKNFTTEEIEEIKNLYEKGISSGKLGKKFNCSHHTIMNIIKEKGKYGKR